jgi:hypothetical protein
LGVIRVEAGGKKKEVNFLQELSFGNNPGDG